MAEDKIDSWSEAKKVIASANAKLNGGEVRYWASRVRALKHVTEFSKNLPPRRTFKVEKGEFGICRHRVIALLRSRLGEGEAGPELTFGELYSVIQISKSRKFIRVASRCGQVGWMKIETHFGITAGEYKILSASNKTRVLNYLVNAIHIG